MGMSDNVYTVRCPACGKANRIPASREGQAGKCGACHAALPSLYTRPVTLTEINFDAFVMDYAGPVVVEFWSPT